MAYGGRGVGAVPWEPVRMINPIHPASTAETAATYKVEPYVVAADVYALSPHTGRGGWTWYTGSAGWMYRLLIQSLLRPRLDVDQLYFSPCLPPKWGGFQLHHPYPETGYHISIAPAV